LYEGYPVSIVLHILAPSCTKTQPAIAHWQKETINQPKPSDPTPIIPSYQTMFLIIALSLVAALAGYIFV
jgi:hypothetical protein